MWKFHRTKPCRLGGTIQIDTGCLVAFEDSIDYNIEFIGGLDQKGLKNVLFGGEGIFFATLSGNGKVWIQSMNITSLSRTIMKKGTQPSTEDRTDFGGFLKGL